MSEHDKDYQTLGGDELDDDAPVGRVLSRREMFRALAGAGVALAAGYGTVQAGTPGPARSLTERAASPGSLSGTRSALSASTVRLPSCVVRPALTEGPYFVDERLNRSDIRIDTPTGTVSPGALLQLTFNVTQINGGCAPLQGAMLDVWHCDADGRYSDVQQYVGHNWLRGFQLTDANGVATFTTIYPGWYTGRAVHIHFKIRINNYTFTSQLFFDDLFTDSVYQQPPYSTRGPRDTRNADDGIYRNGGSQMLLTVAPDGNGGYASNFDIGLAISGGTPIPTTTATVASTSTAVATNTAVTTNTPQSTATATDTPAATSTINPTGTPAATETSVPCQVTFSDVNHGDYFYQAVTFLACNGAVTGYSDGTFRPYNNTTRAQFVKMIVLSQGWSLALPPRPTFSDVPQGSPFYVYVETAVARGIISGYADNTFRPNNSVTRGQVCKVIALAHAWSLANPPTPRFSDVDTANPFYRYVETAAARGVISGYGDNTFRPENPATRGQISKIIYQALAG